MIRAFLATAAILTASPDPSLAGEAQQPARPMLTALVVSVPLLALVMGPSESLKPLAPLATQMRRAMITSLAEPFLIEGKLLVRGKR